MEEIALEINKSSTFLERHYHQIPIRTLLDVRHPELTIFNIFNSFSSVPSFWIYSTISTTRKIFFAWLDFNDSVKIRCPGDITLTQLVFSWF